MSITDKTYIFSSCLQFSVYCFCFQAGNAEMPADDENAIREFLCIKAYLVSSFSQYSFLK